MISMMEYMEEKMPSTNNDRKKGMTLVEVMAAMAILSILFLGVSSFVINIVKNENRSKIYLDNTNYLKSALDAFKLKQGGDVSDSEDTRQYYINNTEFNKYVNKTCYLYFDNMEQMLDKLIKANFLSTQDPNHTTNYELKISVSNKIDGKELYLVEGEILYSKGYKLEENKKKIYVDR